MKKIEIGLDLTKETKKVDNFIVHGDPFSFQKQLLTFPFSEPIMFGSIPSPPGSPSMENPRVLYLNTNSSTYLCKCFLLIELG